MGQKRKRTDGETFAETVADLGEPASSRSELISSPIRDREYLDPDGVRWRKRGGIPTVTRVEHLIRDRHVRVLHLYLSDVRDVSAEDRDEFLSKIRPYLKGSRTASPQDYSDFVAAEFKDDQQRSMLVVEESC
ncbi:MAG: hypothetical protein QOG10_1713 [Kribbellaceae bacterium]|nr:hypothetical protein [Kribbellaceae bacterium]